MEIRTDDIRIIFTMSEYTRWPKQRLIDTLLEAGVSVPSEVTVVRLRSMYSNHMAALRAGDVSQDNDDGAHGGLHQSDDIHEIVDESLMSPIHANGNAVPNENAAENAQSWSGQVSHDTEEPITMPPPIRPLKFQLVQTATTVSRNGK